MAEVRAGTAHAILALFAIAEAVNALYVGLFFWAEPASYAPAPAYAARDLIQRLAPAWITGGRDTSWAPVVALYASSIVWDAVYVGSGVFGLAYGDARMLTKHLYVAATGFPMIAALAYLVDLRANVTILALRVLADGLIVACGLHRRPGAGAPPRAPPPHHGHGGHVGGGRRAKQPWWFWAIALFFAKELVYAGYMVFATTDPRLGPGAQWAPLWGDNAAKMRPEIFLRRRLYAIEFWVAFGGFAVFVATMCRARPPRPPPPPLHRHEHGE